MGKLSKEQIEGIKKSNKNLIKNNPGSKKIGKNLGYGKFNGNKTHEKIKLV